MKRTSRRIPSTSKKSRHCPSKSVAGTRFLGSLSRIRALAAHSKPIPCWTRPSDARESRGEAGRPTARGSSVERKTMRAARVAGALVLPMARGQKINQMDSFVIDRTIEERSHPGLGLISRVRTGKSTSQRRRGPLGQKSVRPISLSVPVGERGERV